MKKKTFLILIAVISVIVALIVIMQRNLDKLNEPKAARSAAEPAPANTVGPQPIPAHYEQTPSLRELRATLPPESFTGKVREAYQAVREIPQTIAQMPCYCHCDRSIGHKSLHSCFEDDHAANCATCIGEALAAYEMSKQGLSPEQIRERIIAEYAA